MAARELELMPTTEAGLDFQLDLTALILDAVALDRPDEQTYKRNHYFNIDAARIGEFKKRLDDALRGLAEELAAESSDTSRFFNVLATGVCIEGDDE